jgi:hypothetical protein
MDHVERSHLDWIKPDEEIPCYHPVCKAEGIALEHKQHFKNHFHYVHGIALRP